MTTMNPMNCKWPTSLYFDLWFDRDELVIETPTLFEAEHSDSDHEHNNRQHFAIDDEEEEEDDDFDDFADFDDGEALTQPKKYKKRH